MGATRLLEEKRVPPALDLVAYLQKNPDSWVFFADVEKAYPSVHHEQLLDLLARSGLSPETHQVIAALYAHPVSRAMLPNGLSREYLERRGARQGCPLSPLLFVFMYNFVIRQIADSPGWKGFFADDAALACPGPLMQEVIDKLEKALESIGMLLHPLKSKFTHGPGQEW